jgi:hypothetical protein
MMTNYSENAESAFSLVNGDWILCHHSIHVLALTVTSMLWTSGRRFMLSMENIHAQNQHLLSPYDKMYEQSI